MFGNSLLDVTYIKVRLVCRQSIWSCGILLFNVFRYLKVRAARSLCNFLCLFATGLGPLFSTLLNSHSIIIKDPQKDFIHSKVTCLII
jgi:hypothetical protein